MTAYTVHFTMPASTSVRVEAADPDEAIDKAYNDISAGLCHQCAGDLDLAGEWEPCVVTDDDTGSIAWEEPL